MNPVFAQLKIQLLSLVAILLCATCLVVSSCGTTVKQSAVQAENGGSIEQSVNTTTDKDTDVDVNTQLDGTISK